MLLCFLGVDENCFQVIIYFLNFTERVAVVVAEWLRRWTRNPLGSSRAGSNPADNANFLTGGCHELKPKNIRISDDLVKEYIV